MSTHWFRCFPLLGRPWPVFFGTGIGLGMAYSNCQNDFRSPYVPSQPLAIARTNAQVLTVRHVVLNALLHAALL